MAVSQVAEAIAARLADPAGSGGLAVIRTISHKKLYMSMLTRRRMSLISDKDGINSAGDLMGRVDDFDLEPLQRSMAGVPAAHQVEVRAIDRVQSHRVV